MEQMEEKSLKFSKSPLCPIAADVICDEESIYFYMYDLDFEKQQLIARSACWVKNLILAPESFDREKMDAGRQPVLPAKFVKEDMDLQMWKEEDLEIIWSKEGHIAGLLHDGALVCVIPSWADGHNFPGYSLYAKENSMVAWKLDDAYLALLPRMEEGRMFWKQEFNQTWQAYHTPYYQGLCQSYGKASNIYDLNKDNFPSRLLISFEIEDMIYAFTIGCGMFSMPNADRCYDDYEKHARNEFAIAISKKEYNEEERLSVFTDIARLCDLAWQKMECITHGHLIHTDKRGYEHCVLVNDNMFLHPLDLSIKQEDVNLCWIIAVSDEELEALQDENQKEETMRHIASKESNRI